MLFRSGELAAWIIGWALILEYAIGNIVVAISWSGYFNGILKGIGIALPDWLTIGYGTAKNAYFNALAKGEDVSGLIYTNAPNFLGVKFIVNFPAFMITVLVTALAYVGIKESKRIANGMVLLKLIVLTIVILVGVFYIQDRKSVV